MTTLPALPASPRRFSLLDAMILTAAAAIALLPPYEGFLLELPTKLRAWSEWVGHLTGRRVVPALVGRDVGNRLAKDALMYTLGLLRGPLTGLTLALIVSRIRRPRPPWRALIRQPGFVACLAVPSAFVVFLEANYLGARLRPEPLTGLAVAAAWLLLLTTRRWEPEPGWIDRLGRLAGVGWIVAASCESIERWI